VIAERTYFKTARTGSGFSPRWVRPVRRRNGKCMPIA